jgi:hypothetical protein
MSVFDDFQLRLATPIIIRADADDDDLAEEFLRMRVRSYATKDFLDGQISVTEYIEALEDNGVDSAGASDAWESGHSLLGFG